MDKMYNYHMDIPSPAGSTLKRKTESISTDHSKKMKADIIAETQDILQNRGTSVVQASPNISAVEHIIEDKRFSNSLMSSAEENKKLGLPKIYVTNNIKLGIDCDSIVTSMENQEKLIQESSENVFNKMDNAQNNCDEDTFQPIINNVFTTNNEAFESSVFDEEINAELHSISCSDIYIGKGYSYDSYAFKCSSCKVSFFKESDYIVHKRSPIHYRSIKKSSIYNEISNSKMKRKISTRTKTRTLLTDSIMKKATKRAPPTYLKFGSKLSCLNSHSNITLNLLRKKFIIYGNMKVQCRKCKRQQRKGLDSDAVYTFSEGEIEKDLPLLFIPYPVKIRTEDGLSKIITMYLPLSEDQPPKNLNLMDSRNISENDAIGEIEMPVKLQHTASFDWPSGVYDMGTINKVVPVNQKSESVSSNSDNYYEQISDFREHENILNTSYPSIRKLNNRKGKDQAVESFMRKLGLNSVQSSLSIDKSNGKLLNKNKVTDKEYVTGLKNFEENLIQTFDFDNKSATREKSSNVSPDERNSLNHHIDSLLSRNVQLTRMSDKFPVTGCGSKFMTKINNDGRIRSQFAISEPRSETNNLSFNCSSPITNSDNNSTQLSPKSNDVTDTSSSCTSLKCEKNSDHGSAPLNNIDNIKIEQSSPNKLTGCSPLKLSNSAYEGTSSPEKKIPYKSTSDFPNCVKSEDDTLSLNKTSDVDKIKGASNDKDLQSNDNEPMSSGSVPDSNYRNLIKVKYADFKQLKIVILELHKIDAMDGKSSVRAITSDSPKKIENDTSVQSKASTLLTLNTVINDTAQLTSKKDKHSPKKFKQSSLTGKIGINGSKRISQDISESKSLIPSSVFKSDAVEKRGNRNDCYSSSNKFHHDNKKRLNDIVVLSPDKSDCSNVSAAASSNLDVPSKHDFSLRQTPKLDDEVSEELIEVHIPSSATFDPSRVQPKSATSSKCSKETKETDKSTSCGNNNDRKRLIDTKKSLNEFNKFDGRRPSTLRSSNNFIKGNLNAQAQLHLPEHESDTQIEQFITTKFKEHTEANQTCQEIKNSARISMHSLLTNSSRTALSYRNIDNNSKIPFVHLTRVDTENCNYTTGPPSSDVLNEYPKITGSITDESTLTLAPDQKQLQLQITHDDIEFNDAVNDFSNRLPKHYCESQIGSKFYNPVPLKSPGSKRSITGKKNNKIAVPYNKEDPICNDNRDYLEVKAMSKINYEKSISDRCEMKVLTDRETDVPSTDHELMNDKRNGLNSAADDLEENTSNDSTNENDASSSDENSSDGNYCYSSNSEDEQCYSDDESLHNNSSEAVNMEEKPSTVRSDVDSLGGLVSTTCYKIKNYLTVLNQSNLNEEEIQSNLSEEDILDTASTDQEETNVIGNIENEFEVSSNIQIHNSEIVQDTNIKKRKFGGAILKVKTNSIGQSIIKYKKVTQQPDTPCYRDGDISKKDSQKNIKGRSSVQNIRPDSYSGAIDSHENINKRMSKKVSND